MPGTSRRSSGASAPAGSAPEDTSRAVFGARVPWLAVIVFSVLACGLAWLVALPIWLRGADPGDTLFGLVATVMMYTPALAAVLVILLVQRPRPGRIGEYLGFWPLRPAKRTIWMSVVAIFGVSLIVIAGTFLAAVLGQINLDLAHFSGFRHTLHAAVAGTPGGTAAIDRIPFGLLVAIQLIQIPITAVLPNGLLALGEELGWRGWLLPTLRPLGTWPALAITGAIWGFWHTPLILRGYNFGLTNGYGVALMIAACVLLGIVIGWLRLRTASIWPCVFAHGALNAAAGFGQVVVAAGHHIPLISAGPLGWATWIVLALVIAILIATGQITKQPRLQRKLT